MLSNNLPDLEVCFSIVLTMSTKLISKKVLVFEVDANNELHSTVNVDGILSSARWPRLRILRFHGTNCGVAPLVSRGASQLGRACPRKNDARPPVALTRGRLAP